MEVEVTNDKFLEALFPPWEYIQAADTPLYENVIIYGAQGMGKTTTWRYLVAKAREKYGPNRVNAVYSEDIEALLKYGLKSGKPIQILVAEDVTLSDPPDEAYKEFFTLRHKLDTGKGLVITISTVHDFFCLKKFVRTYFQFLLLNNAPTNQYDYYRIRQYVGKDMLEQLYELTKLKHYDHDAKAYVGYWFLGTKGFIKVEPVPIHVIQIPPIEEDEIYTPFSKWDKVLKYVINK